jgi:phosphoglucomutase
MSFKPNKIRVIEFDTDYINSLKLIVDEDKIKDAFTGFIISPYHGNNLLG